MAQALLARLQQQGAAKSGTVLTGDEKTRQQLLAVLDELGSGAVGDDSIAFEGTKIILPASLAGPGGLQEAGKFLHDYEEQQETKFEMSREFPYRPYDGAAAFDRAMKRVFGTAGIGKSWRDMFGGEHLPQLISVDTGPDSTEQVPWDLVKFSLLDAVFDIEYIHDEERGILSHISVTAPRKHKARIEGFFRVIEDELRQRSIYRGKAVTGAEHPGFFDERLVDPRKVVYNDDVIEQLNANVWSVIDHADQMRLNGIPLKRAFLLEGSWGCISGDAGVTVNRGGKGFSVRIEDLVRRLNGEDARYSWDPDIPTFVQREVNGVVRLARLERAWCSGVKQTFKVTTDTGREIRATDEHPFLTERGWLRLDELKVGDEVHVRGEQKGDGRTVKPLYERATAPHHPYRDAQDLVPVHRMVTEAEASGVSYEEFLAKVRSGDTAGMQFLDTSVWAVHHKDTDSHNNDPGNLQVMTHREHHQLHAKMSTANNVLCKVATERVVSVESYGEEMTYDLSVEGDPHNFIAEGFVVHNTGKTLAGALTAQHATAAGWTFILVRPEDNPLMALRTAQLYSPAVVWVEDVDNVANKNKNRAQIGAVLDAMDNIAGKNTEVMVGFTTNYPDLIEKGMLRPGRIDAVIHVGALEASKVERLVRVTVPEHLLKDVDYEQVAKSYDGYVPAYAVEAAQRAVRYSIARGNGKSGYITTRDLVFAADGLRRQLDMMNAAEEAGDLETLDGAMRRVATQAAENVLRRTQLQAVRAPFVVEAARNGQQ